MRKKWHPELIFTQKGYERILAFCWCKSASGDCFVADLFMSDKCKVVLVDSNGVEIQKEGGKA